ncbi:hypothetical protein L202_07669 [Cryptococcus amylolentus CBS 6039]|uniref:Uncharacterized protein n=1 Tax=Cryptococcus amylolentus CBS 6039 TaxID=1295533 RepID=A0A1E3HD18_9TREE|nr:hypothetical protein L202_07669 [Cryptococcus amylolentus CBS 6039]ODN74224.1 hypothetical protein L202_07669 [Cryptococcus amylolentus CBS 6039]
MLHRLPRTLPLLSSTLTTIRTMSSTAPSSPINLVSVNTHPDRAQRVIGSVIQSVKDKYTIVHAGNSTTIEGVKPLLESTQPRPDILFCASMWTPEEQTEIQQIAKNTIPGIKTYAIPTGMHVKAGPEGITKYLTERIDSIVNGK